MDIYVSELPKDCSECSMCRSGSLKLQRKGRYIEAQQCVFGKYKYQTIDDEIDTCPLRLISEERKKVVQEIRTQISKLKKLEPKHDIGYDCDDVMLSYLDISEKLDQIEENLSNKN